MIGVHTAIKQQENLVFPTKLIIPPEGFYCEAAAGSAEEAFADKAQQ